VTLKGLVVRRGYLLSGCRVAGVACLMAVLAVPWSTHAEAFEAPSLVGTEGSPIADAPSLATIDLGTLGGPLSDALDVNQARDTVGASWTSTGYVHAFLWTAHSGMADLGTVASSYSQANAINNRGHVVGQSGHGFFWTSQTGMVDLGAFQPVDINDSDQVLGNDAGAAFVWSPATGLTQLGSLGGASAGTAINNRGEIVGTSYTATGARRAFVWSPLNGMRDIGTLGGSDSAANGINDRGEVVGGSTTSSGAFHPFRWSAETGMLDLALASPPTLFGPITGTARGVNNRGEVVGSGIGVGNSIRLRPFKWSAAVGIVNLPGPGFGVATAISDRGDVAGVVGQTSSSHAVIWIGSP